MYLILDLQDKVSQSGVPTLDSIHSKLKFWKNNKKIQNKKDEERCRVHSNQVTSLL